MTRESCTKNVTTGRVSVFRQVLGLTPAPPPPVPRPYSGSPSGASVAPGTTTGESRSPGTVIPLALGT